MAAQEFQRVLDLFGAYKAEWLNGRLFKLFEEPQYFSQLKQAKPCVLIGGRGTGKTTVLRGLSYEGQFELSGRTNPLLPDVGFIGLYHRININRVSAFQGSELSREQWGKCFAHYLNLIFCDLMLEYAEWFERNCDKGIELDGQELSQVCASLVMEDASTLSQLRSALKLRLSRFEAEINNVVDTPPANLSLAAAPIDLLASALVKSSCAHNRPFCFLIDEFENLDNHQQRVLNTYIKHASMKYTFKIGVRELGWRDRRTLNENEILRHPADYARISIDEYMQTETFRDFAARVCKGRVEAAMSGGSSAWSSITDLLPGISQDDEAELLGAREQIAYCRREILKVSDERKTSFASGLSSSRLYFLTYWAAANKRSVVEEFERAFADQARWEQDYNNHGYAALFTIRRGKRGIRKYYAGWETLVRLASGNIRFLLELVHESLSIHAERDRQLLTPISVESQTLAAQQVGRKNLAELEGLSVEGARLIKLVLALGRVFQLHAEHPEGHAPEVNQFYVPDLQRDVSASPEAETVNKIIVMAVMNLALVRSPGTKLVEESDTREYDYMLHPIFAPLFGFSHRKKRKMKLAPAQVLGLVEDPAATISEILSTTRRSVSEDLPDQLHLFESFYAGSARTNTR